MSDDPHHDPSFATTYSQFSSLFDNFADQKQVHSHHGTYSSHHLIHDDHILIRTTVHSLHRLRKDNSPGSPSQSQSTAVPGSRRTYSPFSDDDRSTARPSSPRSLHRRASHVQQWLEQQPNVSPNPSHDVRTTPRAKDRGNYSYAYRTPSGAHDPTRDSSDQTDDGTLGSFVLVPGDEADIPPREFLEDENGQVWLARDRSLLCQGTLICIVFIAGSPGMQVLLTCGHLARACTQAFSTRPQRSVISICPFLPIHDVRPQLLAVLHLLHFANRCSRDHIRVQGITTGLRVRVRWLQMI